MSCVRFSVAKQNKPRLETRARSHVTADSTGRPGHVGDHPGPDGPQKRRGDPERDARRGGRRDHRRRALRAQRGAEGLPGRPLRARPDRQGRQDESQGAETERGGVRVGGDRTIPSARGERRGGADRHVFGRRLHPAGRRCQPAAVGRPHALADPERQAQEGIRRHRRMAWQAPRTGLPVPVHGRRVAQKVLGRVRGEREHPGGRRRRYGRAARGAFGGRGHEGGLGKLARIHQRHARARPQGREAGDGRPVRRAGGGCERIAARRPLPAVHGPLRTQHPRQGQPQKQGLGRRRAEGHILHGIEGQGAGEGGIRRQGHGGAETEGGRQMPQGGHRRDHDLPARRLPPRASPPHPNEQHDRTAEPRDPPAHARGRQLPGRAQRVDAHLRESPLRNFQRVVDATLPRHVKAR